MQQEGLILAAQSGDIVALNRLLAACQTDARRYARRYARRHCAVSDVDDAVQEALLVLSRKVKGLKAAAAFSGWLFTIVRRECQRLSRRMLGQGVSGSEEEGQFLSSSRLALEARLADTVSVVRAAAVDLASLLTDWNVIPMCRTPASRR